MVENLYEEDNQERDLQVITDKNQVISEEDWKQFRFTIFDESEPYMSFRPPAFKLLRGLDNDHLFISAWDSEEWNAFDEWRKVNEIEEISGTNIELWLQDYLKLKKVFLTDVYKGSEAGGVCRSFYFYYKKS